MILQTLGAIVGYRGFHPVNEAADHLEHATSLLAYAEQCLLAADALLERGIYSRSAEQSARAAEQSLKAAILSAGVRYRLTKSCLYLLRQACLLGLGPLQAKPLRDAALKLECVDPVLRNLDADAVVDILPTERFDRESASELVSSARQIHQAARYCVF